MVNVQLMDPVKTVPKQAERYDVKKSQSLVYDQRSTSPQSSSIPFYFHCLGGNWEGQIQSLETGSLELRIQGFPPVKTGQEITFQCFGEKQVSLSQLPKGIIQHSQVHPGLSAWEGATHIIVGLYASDRSDQQSLNSKKDSAHEELGSFVFGQVTEGEGLESCATQPPVYNLTTFRSSREWKDESLKSEACPKIANTKSTRFSAHNERGQVIVAYHDYPTETDLSSLPIVVIAPGYGETKRDYLTLAYYFASNGFHVIRYDHTNHVGESQGVHFDISLSSMKDDFYAMTQFAHQQWPHSPVIGVASSLASRVALKAEAEKSSLALLVLLVGIVDVQQSVATVHQEDVFGNYLNGHIQDSANILGFNVGRHFLQDAIANKFSTLNTTLEDVQSLETPAMYISAGKDAWIDGKDLETFKQSIGSRLLQWLEVPEALHRLQENPQIARATYRQIIDHCRKYVAMPSQEQSIQEPNRWDWGRQNRQEKTARQQESFTDVGQTFWSDYLGHFQTVGKCPDYVQLLDHVFHALGPITPGQRFLDAGCGNGNAGLFFLQSLQEPKNKPHLISDYPVRYVGIDVIHEALGRAQSQMTQAYGSLQRALSGRVSPVQMSWSQVDLQHPLPFADHQFDRIVSNLVLGYVAEPQAALRELFRVLAPGGRMIISNLKPNGDFSGIYQNLVSHAGQKDQKAEARELLNNYGKIRQAEKEGQFRFFHQTEWRNALDSLDCVHGGVYPTFANQAYLIVLEKPAASPESSLFPNKKSDSLFQPNNGFANVFKKVA